MAAFPQGKSAEDGIEGIAQSRAQPQQNGPQAEGRRVPDDTGHEDTAQDCEQQSRCFVLCHTFPEQNRGQYHDKDRGGIEHDRRDRKGRDRDQAEIAEVKESHTHNTGTDKTPDISQADLQQPPVIDQQEQEEEDGGGDGPQYHDVQGIKTCLIEGAYKRADAAPADPCCQNEQDAPDLFTLLAYVIIRARMKAGCLLIDFFHENYQILIFLRQSSYHDILKNTRCLFEQGSGSAKKRHAQTRRSRISLLYP